MDLEAVEILTNIVYSLQNNPEVKRITVKDIEKSYKEIYGPVWIAKKSIEQVIKDNPLDFETKEDNGSTLVSIGTISWWNNDPQRKTYRGEKKKKKDTEVEKSKKKDKKSIFDLFKKGGTSSEKKKKSSYDFFSKLNSGTARSKEEKPKQKKKNYTIFDYQEQRRQEEERLERELEEEVERIERMEKEEKRKEEEKKRKEEEKRRKKEEKKRKKEEKKRKKEELKAKKMEEKRKKKNSQFVDGNSLEGIDDKKKKPKTFFASRREDFDIFKEIKFSNSFLSSRNSTNSPKTSSQDDSKVGSKSPSKNTAPRRPQTFANMKRPAKVVISEPKDFKRVGRVQIDSKKGYIFENMSNDMKTLFEECGIPEEMLHEEKQAKRLYNRLLKEKDKKKFVNFEENKKDGNGENDENNKEESGEKKDGSDEKKDGPKVEEVDVKLDDLKTEKLKKILNEVKKLLSLRDAIIDEEERMECIVCYENYRNILFEPCCHLLICEDCSKKAKMKVCPFCRIDVSKQKKVFF